MRFSILNFLLLVVALAAIIAWRLDKTRFENAIASYGEYEPEDGWEAELFDGDVIDVVNIDEFAFVYCYSDMEPDTSAVTELDELGSPANAEKNGRPSAAVWALINDDPMFKNRLHLETVTADGSGDFKFWKIAWSLLPAEGGFSGVPYQFRAYVRPDGTAVQPRI